MVFADGAGMSVSVGIPGETAAEHELDGQAISQEIMMCRPLSRHRSRRAVSRHCRERGSKLGLGGSGK